MNLQQALLANKISAYAIPGLKRDNIGPIIHTKIIEIVCIEHNIKFEDLQIVGNKKIIFIRPRQIICYLIDNLTPNKLSRRDIANLVGYKNHSAVCHSIKNIQNLIDTEPEFKQEIETLKEKIIC